MAKGKILMREFSRRIHHYLPIESIPNTTLELLALMQHYAVPTRLLDFTKSPFIALYFAVKDILMDKDAAIWALMPHNIRTISLKRIREKDEELVKGIGKLLNPFDQLHVNHYLRNGLWQINRMPRAMRQFAITN